MMNANPDTPSLGPRLPARLLTGLLAFSLAASPILSVAAPAHSTSKASAKATATPGTESSYPTLVIGPGDLLTIFVYGENGLVGSGPGGALDQLPTAYQVDSDGVILFPFLGRVRLGGLTPVEAGEKIARLLSKPRKVTVMVAESSTFWVSVLGNVPKPGRFQITGRPTLLSALSEAGGPLPDTDLGGAILVHGKEKTKVDLGKYLKDTDVKMQDPYLYPGDVLLVQRTGWPTTGEWAIIASILASGAIIAVEVNNIHK
jgi:polysaccharide export outer membrane protein